MQRRSCHVLAARPIASLGPPSTVSSAHPGARDTTHAAIERLWPNTESSSSVTSCRRPSTASPSRGASVSKDVDDGSQVGPLLEQIAGPVASFTGDGAYDRDDVYREVCQRHPDAAVIVPPRSSAVPSATAETAPTRRDQHLQLIT